MTMKYIKNLINNIYRRFLVRREMPVLADTALVYNKIEELEQLKLKNRAFPNYENELRKSYTALIDKSDIVIDIGAHSGMHLGIFLNLVGDGGSVWGFEPLPNQFALMKKNFSSHKNVILVNKALSDKVGTFDFFEVDGTPEESSLVIRDHYNDPSKAMPNKISVEVDKLDNYLDKFSKIDYIKIDAEGAEMNILEASVKILKRFRPILSIEYGYPTYHMFGFTKPDLFIFAQKHGYALSDLWGNIIADMKVWQNACDSVYWDFFLVPRERLELFKERLNTLFPAALPRGYPCRKV
jgi:FkbM family methyltransferase